MNISLMTVVTYLSILGIPSVFALTVSAITMIRKYSNQIIILMAAQKAQMRSQLLKDYQGYNTRGWISDIELQEWCNQYKAYHQLVGENGVLDDRYDQILRLPNTKPTTRRKTVSKTSNRKRKRTTKTND